MNKRELIKYFEDLSYISVSQIGKKAFINLINQLDEPQKPVVPQFVADWYEEHKDNLEYNIWDWIRYTQEEEKIQNRQFTEWLGKSENDPVETLVKMKLFGYEVEKEKQYTVKVKSVFGQYLGRYYLNDEDLIPQFTSTQLTGRNELPTFTRKELEEAGFGWIFSCEGIEVEEVE